MKFDTSSPLKRSLSETQFVWVTRVLLSSSILLIIAISYSYDSINKELTFYSEKVNQSQHFISTLKDVSSEIHEATSFSNSYLISKDTVYFNKTLAAFKGLSKNFQNLDSMITYNAPQRNRTGILKGHLDRFVDHTGSRLSASSQGSVSNRVEFLIKTHRISPY